MTDQDKPLTVEQAIADLIPPDDNPADTTEETSDTPPPDDGSEEQAAPGDTGDTTTHETAEPVEPPRWWSREAKARFAELPPELQAVVFAQEETRERIVARARQESQRERQAAQERTADLTQRITAIDAFLPTAIQTFRNKWDGVDWAALPAEVGAEETLKRRAQYEAEQNQLALLHRQAEAAEAERLALFDAEQAEALKTAAPDLVDEKLGPTRKAKIARELLSKGFDPERIRWMNAEEAAYVNDALKWREAQKSVAGRANRRPSNPQPLVRPTAAAPAPSQPRALKDAEARFNRDPSRKNLEALLKLQG